MKIILFFHSFVWAFECVGICLAYFILGASFSRIQSKFLEHRVAWYSNALSVNDIDLTSLLWLRNEKKKTKQPDDIHSK